jgi:hypothetical protein
VKDSHWGKENSKGKTSIGETQADSWEKAIGNSTGEAPKNEMLPV